MQTGAAAGWGGGNGADSSGAGATGRRPVAGRQRRRYCGHGRGRRPSSRGAAMSFTLRKDKHGVVVVGVDGQLIVGNRQELKRSEEHTSELPVTVKSRMPSSA